MSHPTPLLFYDGDCGFCARSVQFVLAHERHRHSLRFAPLQGQRATSALGSCPAARAVDSVVWYEAPAAGQPERVLLRSDAVLEVWRYLGGSWRLLAGPASLVPRSWRDKVYDLIARHRHSVAGSQHCIVPAPADRPRFLDLPPV